MKKSLLLTTFIFTCAFAFSQTLAGTSDKSLVTTTGEATVYAAPDEIQLSLTILESGQTVQEARAKNKQVSARAIAFLRKSGIAEPHIQTQYQYINPVKERHPSNTVIRYDASQSIEICIKDLSKYEAIVDGLLDLGVSRIGSPIFRTTESRKHKDEARKQAIRAAKEKAEMLAKELGQSIGKAHVITEVTYSYFDRGNAYSNFIGGDSGGSGSSGASFAPGQLEIKATISVSFLLL